MKKWTLVLALLASSSFSAMSEEAYVQPVSAYIASTVGPVVSSAEVVDAIKAQNAANVALDQAGIDGLDAAWKAEASAGSGPVIDAMLAKAVSKKLAELRSGSGGVITEVFVMDAKGLNVAQSDVTSDLWQGDEDKFSKSFGAGAGAVFVDEVEKDESTQALQTQASMTIVDPADGKPIGAVTVGINLDKM